MPILSGSEFQSFIVLGKKEKAVYQSAGMDGIVCFSIDLSSASQNWLKISGK